MTDWYTAAKKGEHCTLDTHCLDATADGWCEACQTIDGRLWHSVTEYVSTCDNCAEPFSTETLTMDMKTHLGYCADCIPVLPEKITDNLERELS